MSARDPEILELLADKPELLAIADAIAETQRAPKRRRVRVTAPRALALAAVVAGLILVVLLAPGGGGNHGILDRALAAIGEGRVLHVVTRSPTGSVLVDLKSGRRVVETYESEVWADRQSNRFHVLIRVDGRIAGDAVGRIAARKTEPAFAALWSGYRQALANGTAKLERTGSIDGRRVYWLRFRSQQAGVLGTEVAVDRRTYKPVVFRAHVSPTHHLDSRVLVAETTLFRGSDFRRRGPSVRTSGTSSIGSSSSFPAQGPRRPPVVRAPWLTPGKIAAGLRLVFTGRTTERSTQGRTAHGFQLVYGTVSGTVHSLDIDEYIRPLDASAWKSIPHGWIRVQQGETSDQHGTHANWTGSLVKRGVYVTIETGRGERAVLATARALHRAP